MNGATINVEYSCEPCGVVWRPVAVREREDDEDVVHWTEWALTCVTADHRRTSPECESRTVDLKIPMANPEARVGMAVRQ